MSTALTAALFIYGMAIIVSMGVAGMISAIYWTVRFANARKERNK